MISELLGRLGDNKPATEDLTAVVDLVRELGCLSEVIGREYEVRDANGKLVYTVVQKPMKINQLNALQKGVHSLRLIEKDSMPKMKSTGRRRR